jgi:hypothetical protein
MLAVPANRAVYRLLRDGIPIQVRQPDGSLKDERVAIIDWRPIRATTTFFSARRSGSRAICTKGGPTRSVSSMASRYC